MHFFRIIVGCFQKTHGDNMAAHDATQKRLAKLEYMMERSMSCLGGAKPMADMNNAEKTKQVLKSYFTKLWLKNHVIFMKDY